MTGAEIKEIYKASGVYMWQVAKAYGCAESTFCKKLRGDFNDEEAEKILAIIDKLSEQKKNDN